MFFYCCCCCCCFAYSICSNHTDLLAVHWTKQGHFHLRVFALAIPSTLNILSSSNHTEYACTSSDPNSTVTSSECLLLRTLPDVGPPPLIHSSCFISSSEHCSLYYAFHYASSIHLNKNIGLKGMRIFYFHGLAYITEFIKLFQWITNCYIMSSEANYF